MENQADYKLKAKEQLFDDEEDTKLLTMPLGEYFLHIYILETSNLDTEEEIDGIISIKAFGEEKHTTIKKDLGPGSKTFWGEHIFFNKQFTNREELENAFFSLGVFSHRTISKNDEVGSTSGSLTQIYALENHIQKPKWALLTNPRKDFRRAMGYIKYAINFSRASDPKPNLEIDEYKNTEESMKIDVPPNIRLKEKQLVIKMYKASDIVVSDTVGTVDPYISFDLGGLEIKTEYQKDNQNPKFYKKIYIPTVYPTVVNALKIKLEDDDFGSSNELLGSYNVSMNDIKQGKYLEDRWIYFYGGSTKPEDKDVALEMNRIPELASTLKGRLKLAIELTDVDIETDESKFGIEDMTKPEIDSENTHTEEFVFRFDIEFAQHIHKDGDRRSIQMKWGDKEVGLDSLDNTNGLLKVFRTIQVGQRFEIDNLLSEEEMYDQMPDLIFYLIHKDEPVSYYRFKPKAFTTKSKAAQSSFIVEMIADASKSDLKQNFAGIFKLRCVVGRTNEVQQHATNWPTLTRNPEYEPILIVCDLYQAKDLIPFDSDSQSDPLVCLYNLGYITASSVFPNTLNPSWNERLILKSLSINGSIAPLVVSLLDKDTKTLSNDTYEFMGSNIVNLKEWPVASTAEDIETPVKPTWYNLSIDRNTKSGKIKLAFKVIKQSQFNTFKQINPKGTARTNIDIPKTRYRIKINMLGLRDLQSTGILPVRSVEVKISTSSIKNLNNMKGGSGYSELSAVSKNGGNNPALGTVLNITAPLPKHILNMPIISCRVVDKGISILKGESLIGTFQLNLATHTYISKSVILTKLEILRDLFVNKKGNEVSTERKDEIINSLNGMIKHCTEILKSAENYIKIESPNSSLWKKTDKKANALREMKSKIKPVQPVEIESEAEEEQEEQKMVAKRVRTDVLEKDDDYMEKEDQEENEADDFTNELASSNLFKNKLGTEQQPEPIEEEKMNKEDKPVRSLNPFDLLKEKLFSNLTVKDDKVIFEPEYKTTTQGGSRREYEVKIPDPVKYMQIGFKTKVKNTKHYRLMLNEELENTDFMGDDVFTTIDIFRGKKYKPKKQSFLDRMFNKEESYRRTGSFRGNVEIMEDSMLKNLIKLNLDKSLLQAVELPCDLEEWKCSKLDSDILSTVNVIIVIYVIDAEFYQSEDYNSENDSYMTLQLGNQKIEEDSYIENKNRPKYYRSFRFEQSLPGASFLSIKFFDKDPLKPDDLIGETKIDVERRFFDKTWRQREHNPIEKRNLHHPLTSQQTGSVRLWVDIIPKTQKDIKFYDISPRPKVNLELRFIVWAVYNAPKKDFEDTSDILVKVALPSLGLESKTDTHFRSTTGFGSFNWRIKFKVNIDEYTKPEHLRAEFRIYDKDLLSSDDYIASQTLNLANIVNQVIETESRQYMTDKGYYEDGESKVFYLNAIPNRADREEQEENEESPTKIVVSVDCLTENEALMNPAGVGRSDPNQDPFLPPPTGRFQWTYNPFKFLEQLVGPDFKSKCCVIVILFIVLLFVLLFGPVLVPAIIANVIIT